MNVVARARRAVEVWRAIGRMHLEFVALVVEHKDHIGYASHCAFCACKQASWGGRRW